MSHSTQSVSVPLAALVPPKQTLVILQADATVKHALEVLYAARISAAPVLKNGKLIGLLDMLDLVAFLALMQKKSANQVDGSPHPHRATPDPVVVFNKQDSQEILQKRSDEFNNTKVQDILDLSGRSPLVQLPATASSHQLMDLFSMGVHRVVVLNELDAPVGVISQTDVLTKQTEYAASLLGDHLKKSLASLGFLKPVLSVDKSELAINAFMSMHNHKMSALAVTENGILVDNLSASDLKRVESLQKSTVSLAQPISSFIDSSPKKAPHLANLTRRPLISVDQNETLQHVLRKMAEHHVHRIYIVDGGGHPVGVVTLTNILALANGKK